MSPPTPTHRSAREELDLADGWLSVVSARHHSPREDVHPDHAGFGVDLVLFDMDGTLTRGLSSWEAVHDHFGVTNESKWERYARGELTDPEFMATDIELWIAKGDVHVDEIDRALVERTDLMDHARDLVRALHDRGVGTCIVSGGLDVVARRVCDLTGIHAFVANGLRLNRAGHLTGEGLCFVELRDKGPVTRRVMERLGVRPERTVAIGNSGYDAGMFREAGHGIAFAPIDEAVREAADVVVDGEDMMRLLPVIERYARSVTGE